MLGNSSSSSSSRPRPDDCVWSLTNQILVGIFTLTKLLFILPLCLLVIIVAARRRRSAVPLTHLDVLSFHVASIELVNVLSSVVYFLCTAAQLDGAALLVVAAGNGLSFQGQMLYHGLTCADRYLAVVRPVAYLRLRSRRAFVFIYSGAAALLLLTSTANFLWNLLEPVRAQIPVLFGIVLSLLLASFCSLSVLAALRRRRRPGQRAERLQRRAFVTTVVILAVLLLWFLALLTGFSLGSVKLEVGSCVVVFSCFFFSLPSSAVIQLLFLHRARAPPFCLGRGRDEGGQVLARSDRTGGAETHGVFGPESDKSLGI